MTRFAVSDWKARGLRKDGKAPAGGSTEVETAARREVIEDDEAMDSVLPKNAQKFMAHTVAYSPIWTVNRPPRPVPQSVIDAGCGVAWPSSEGYSFVDPPCLFLAEDMSGSVFAALTSAGEFFCPLDPDQPIRAISDDHLALLHEHA